MNLLKLFSIIELFEVIIFNSPFPAKVAIYFLFSAYHLANVKCLNLKMLSDNSFSAISTSLYLGFLKRNHSLIQ